MAAEHRKHRNHVVAQARDRLNLVLVDESPAIEDIEVAIVETKAILDSRGCVCFLDSDNTVHSFWRTMRGKLVWDLIPFTFAHDLYRAWLKRTNSSKRGLGRNKFIDALVAEVKTDPQWRCIDKEAAVYSGKRMRAVEPLAEQFGLAHWADGSAKCRTHRGLVRVIPSELR